MRGGRARVTFGVLAGLALAVSAGAVGMAAVAAGAVTPVPCSPRGDGACTVSPAKLVVNLPPGTNGVNVTWATKGRPPSIPAQSSVFLNKTDANANCPSGGTTCTWPWPGGLEAATVVLNGTYQLTPCLTLNVGCGAPFLPNVGIAAPPAPPGNVRATAASSSSVTVNWAAGLEPDLAGYSVIRNGTVVFTCSLHGAPLPHSVPCASQLSYTDHPGTGGAVTYGVVANRYGIDGDVAHDVNSTPAVASLNLAGSSGGGGISGLPPIPVIGIPSVPLPMAPPSTAAGAGAAGAGSVPGGPTTTVAPGSGGLEYGAQNRPGALGPVRGIEPGHVTTSVSGLALIATGLLVLALAAHLLYLRGAVARYQMAHSGRGARAAHRRQRPAMRVQWGQWPPLIRDGGDLSSPG